MDDQESSDKQEKKSTQVRVVQAGGRVNVGGLVVVVGALAVSGLVRVVASQIKKRRDANKNRGGHGGGEEDEGRNKGGLSSVLETPRQTSHQNQCCKSNESLKQMSNQIDPIEMLSNGLILEKSQVPGGLVERNGNPAGGDQDVLIQAPVPVTILAPQARDDPDEPEEIQLPAPDGCFDTGEDSTSIEVSEVGKAEQAVDMEVGSEEKGAFQPLPEEQAGQGNDNCEAQETREEEDYIIGKTEDLPKGTGNASESHSGDIRPSDLLRDSPPAPEATVEGRHQEKMVKEEEEIDHFKGSNSNNCCNTINDFEDGTRRVPTDYKFFKKSKFPELLVVSDQVEHKLKTGIWGLSLLGIVLMFCYYLPKTTAWLTALLVTVLSLNACPMRL